MNYDLNVIVSTFIALDHVLIEIGPYGLDIGLVARCQRKMSSGIYRSCIGHSKEKDDFVMARWQSDNLIIIETVVDYHNLDNHLFPSDLGSVTRKTVSFSPLAWPLTRIPPRLVPPPSLPRAIHVMSAAPEVLNQRSISVEL